MLTQYLTRTKRLLQNPSATTQLYSDADLTDYINEGRGWTAALGECIANQATLNVVQGQRPYNFGDIILGTPDDGIGGAIAVRQAARQVGDGQAWMTPRNYQWFFFYRMSTVTPVQGPPNEWSVVGQGAAPQAGLQGEGGTIFVDPVPDTSYVLNLDTVCYPIPLLDDTTPEYIPYLFTDAVPYFAAYKALLASQSGSREAEAVRMYNKFEQFINMARAASTPSVLPGMYRQQPNPTRANQLGLAPASGGGGA